MSNNVNQVVVSSDPFAGMTREQLVAALAASKAQESSLKALMQASISFKVSEKGAMSLYGMGRFPVTLYKDQWIKILEQDKPIRNFIETNDAKLLTKKEAQALNRDA